MNNLFDQVISQLTYSEL